MKTHALSFVAVLVLIALLPFASDAAKKPSSDGNDYANSQITAIKDGKDYPALDREGAMYGNSGGEAVHFAGGVNTMLPNTVNFTAFSDIYTYFTENNTFVKATAELPTKIYFGAAGYANNKLYIFSGRNNTSGNYETNTYSTEMYVVNFAASITAPTVSVLPLNPAPSPRQFCSSFMSADGLLYIFGGVNGDTGEAPVTDVFVSIDTKTGQTAQLPCDGAQNCPIDSVCNPVVFMDQAHDTFYVYSGMHADYTTFADRKLYSYNVTAKAWNAPVTVQNGADMVWNGWAVNYDGSRLLVVGGDAGASGSHNKSWVWDLTKKPPTVTQIKASLPSRCESPVVGIDADGAAWVYSGAIYASSTTTVATSYVHGVVKMTPPAGKEHHYYTNWTTSKTARGILLVVAGSVVALCVVPTAMLIWRARRNTYTVLGR